MAQPGIKAKKELEAWAARDEHLLPESPFLLS